MSTKRRIAPTIILLFAQISLASCGTGNIDTSRSCEAAFYEAIDAGHVNSVNGLAIERDFAAYFFTELFEGRARIVRRQCAGGRFMQARPVFPVDNYHDYQPTLSIDGERLCFTSTRPVTGPDETRQNVWCSSKTKAWLDAAPIVKLVSPFWDGHAIEVAPQIILFASERADNGQMVDIFELDMRHEVAKPVRVNRLSSKITDNDMAFDSHSNTLVFSRYDPVTKDIDLYISFKTRNDWSAPKVLAELTTPEWQMSPAFTPDGKYLLYKTASEPFHRVPMSKILSSQGK